MTPTPEVQDRIRRYLLGQLSDGAREEFEQKLLVDKELFEELLVVEDELNDEYLLGDLPRDERIQFEEHFLSVPERQEKLRFARALNRYVSTASQRERTVGNLLPVSQSTRTLLFRAVAVLAVIILIAGMVVFLRRRSPSPETFALNLTISQSTRGEGSQTTKINLPLREDALKLVLALPGEPPTAARYRVELESSNAQKRSQEAIPQDGKSVTVIIPADELKRGLYSLKVFAVRADGGEERLNGNYFFIVE